MESVLPLRGSKNCLPSRETASVNYNVVLVTDDRNYPSTYNGTNDEPVALAHCQRQDIRRSSSIFKQSITYGGISYTRRSFVHGMSEKTRMMVDKEAPYRLTTVVIRPCDLVEIRGRSSHLQGGSWLVHCKLTVKNAMICEDWRTPI